MVAAVYVQIITISLGFTRQSLTLYGPDKQSRSLWREGFGLGYVATKENALRFRLDLR